MTFGKQFWQAVGAVALGTLVSTAAVGQVTTRTVVAGGSATSVKMVPGGTTSIDVRLDVGTLDAGGTGLVGTGFTLSQITPATSGVFSITGRSFVGSPFNDTSSGVPDSTVLFPPSNLLNPDSDDNLGRHTLSFTPVPPAANTLAANLTLTASGAAALGTYTINLTGGGVSIASDDAANDYDMSTGTPFTILVGQTLTVNKNGTGTGTVTSNVGLINCGATCSDIYAGDTVTLTATPIGTATFTGWTGGGCSGTGTCVVTVNAATTVTATFTAAGPTSPPTIVKAFGTGSILVGGSTSLTFTIGNPNATTLTGISFNDAFPSGLVVSTPSGLVGSCGGGTITAVQGATSIGLSSATLAGSANCSFSVNVTGNTAGTKNNVTGAITSVEGGTGGTASASVTVAGIAAPTIAKSFAPNNVIVGGTSTLSFTITNPNASTAFTGVAFTDNLPAGVVVSTPNGLAGSCGGGTITATAGSGSVSLSGAALPTSGSCTFSVSVTGSTVGTKNNTTGTVSSVEGGTGNTANATLTVAGIAAPTIAKTFGAPAITPAGTTTLTITINNTNAATALTGIGFTDTLPAGLVVSTPNALNATCAGGTITATAGLGSVSLTGGSLAANTSCFITVNVTATSNGTKINVTSAVTSVEGGTGNVANATLDVGVLAPVPTLSQWALLILSLLMVGAAGAVTYSRRKS